METITASKARIPVDTFNNVAYRGERVEVRRERGKASVFIISEEDMRLLEELEDRALAKQARKALKEFSDSGEKAIPFKQVLDEAGI